MSLWIFLWDWQFFWVEGSHLLVLTSFSASGSLSITATRDFSRFESIFFLSSMCKHQFFKGLACSTCEPSPRSFQQEWVQAVTFERLVLKKLAEQVTNATLGNWSVCLLREWEPSAATRVRRHAHATTSKESTSRARALRLWLICHTNHCITPLSIRALGAGRFVLNTCSFRFPRRQWMGFS